jgi:voltage-gated potassium channel
VITITTVGYGEVRPLTTTGLRVHTMLVTVLGSVAVAYMIAGFVQLLAEGEIRQLLGHQRMRRQIDQLNNHAIVAGFGRMGNLVTEELAAAEMPLVVIEQSADRLPELERRGVLYVHGDATEEDVLKDAGLERARVLVTTISSDAESVFITLTARQMAPGVMIVSRAEQPATLKKLRQAGANHVVVPAAIGARRIVSLLTNPSAVEFAELVTSRSSLAIEMDDIAISAACSLNGVTLRDADIGRRTGVIVVAVKRADGRVEFPPTGDEPFAEADSIVVLGRRSNLDQLRKELQI